MPLLLRALHRLPTLRKPQRSFFYAFLLSLTSFFGRATRSQLARNGAPSPRTQARWELKPFDWVGLSLTSLQLESILSHPLAFVIDASFLPKSGRHTDHLGHFWNGTASRIERGLEMSTLGLVDLQEETAYALDTRLSRPATGEKPACVVAQAQLTDVRKRLPEVKHLLVDGGYTSRAFVDAVRALSLHVVGKMRKDAALRYLAPPPTVRRPGRPRKYAGKVKVNALEGGQEVRLAEGAQGWTEVVWSDGLHQKIRVVVVKTKKDGAVILYSTDIELAAAELVRMYRLRFQIEFVFRDAKQHTGLGQGQMRGQKGQEFHLNGSMTACNLLRLEVRRKEVSVGDRKKERYNEKVIQQVLSLLDLDPERPDIQAALQKARSYGTLAA